MSCKMSNMKIAEIALDDSVLVDIVIYISFIKCEKPKECS